MTDFVSILRKAIEGLNDDSAEMRERVYQRARATLWTRLALIGPPPVTVVERHTRALELAIETVEGLYGGQSDANQSTSPVDDSLNPNEQSREGEAPIDSHLQTSMGQSQEAWTDRPAGVVLQEQPSAVAPDAAFEPYQKPARLVTSSGRVVPAALNEAEPIRFVELSRASTYKLEWPVSSRCGICSKWATCIDLQQCWNRADEGMLVLNPQPSRQTHHEGRT